MTNKKTIAFLGGDMRQLYAARVLAKDTWQVRLWGISPQTEPEGGVQLTGNEAEALRDASAVILPLPASTDGHTLYAPLSGEVREIRLRDILRLMPAVAILIGGRIPGDFASLAQESGRRIFDYFHSEAFQVRNAYTTAEAAVSIVMNHLDREVRGAAVAVTGYGRIAKALCDLLAGMGARVTVAARREGDLAWASVRGYQTVRIGTEGADGTRIHRLCRGYDVICNTVPFCLFDRQFLEQVDPKTLLIELASLPGGFDACAVKALSVPVIMASSLPGKYAPVSAGGLIADCVESILQSEVNTE